MNHDPKNAAGGGGSTQIGEAGNLVSYVGFLK